MIVAVVVVVATQEGQSRHAAVDGDAPADPHCSLAYRAALRATAAASWQVFLALLLSAAFD